MPIMRKWLHQQPQPFCFPTVLCAGADDINTSCFNIAMAQNIVKFGDILLDAVEGSVQQIPKIMEKHFGRIDTGGFA